MAVSISSVKPVYTVCNLNIRASSSVQPDQTIGCGDCKSREDKRQRRWARDESRIEESRVSQYQPPLQSVLSKCDQVAVWCASTWQSEDSKEHMGKSGRNGIDLRCADAEPTCLATRLDIGLKLAT